MPVTLELMRESQPKKSPKNSLVVVKSFSEIKMNSDRVVVRERLRFHRSKEEKTHES
jgi:hypothetical protein